MSDVQAEVPRGTPMRDAWESYRLTDDYRNTLRWAIHAEHAPGSLWAAFVKGWEARALKRADELMDAKPGTPEGAELDKLADEIVEQERLDDLQPRITQAVREADEHFERVGGSSRHWVRDCFLPMIEKHGLKIESR